MEAQSRVDLRVCLFELLLLVFGLKNWLSSFWLLAVVFLLLAFVFNFELLNTPKARKAHQNMLFYF
jgi:type II secretory pathway component PulF